LSGRLLPHTFWIIGSARLLFGNIRLRTGNTWIEFLNVVEYPPSITFTLMTMGMDLIILALFTRAGEKA